MTWQFFNYRSFLFVTLCFVLTVLFSAHSGDTDKKGGHFDHSNGTYHYHHGLSPHQHIAGKCELQSGWGAFEKIGLGAGVFTALCAGYWLGKKRKPR